MFSHLSKHDVLLHSASSVLGVFFIIVGVVLHGSLATAEGVLAGVATSTPGTATSAMNHPTHPVVVATYTGACGTGVIGVSWELPGASTGVYYKVFREGLILYEGVERKLLDRELSPGIKKSYVVYAFGPNQILLGTGYNFGIAPYPCSTPEDRAPSSVQTTTVTESTPTPPPATQSAPPTYIAPPPVHEEPVSTLPTPAENPPPSKAIDTKPIVPPVVKQQPEQITPPVKNVEPKVTKPTLPPTTKPPLPPTPPEAKPVMPSPTGQFEASTTLPVKSVEREIVTPVIAATPAPFSTTTEKKVATLFTLVAVFDETDQAREESRDRIIALIDQKLLEVQSKMNGAEREARREELIRIRAMVIANVSGRLNQTLDTDEQVARATTEIVRAFDSLTPVGASHPDAEALRKPVEEALAPLKTAALAQAAAIEEKGAGSLYKDTNNDGISDYESVHVYNIDPVKPSLSSVYNGKQITAGEKIVLGFDPTKVELTPITPEEPERSPAPVAPSYSVSSVKLTIDSRVALEGRALPNSYVTLFIYSTPIVVTVKSDADGVWQYTLSKELADGSHTVSVATVDNSGRILAKSASIPFTKTAQAATLDSYTSGFVASTDKPSLLSVGTLYLLGMILVGIILLTLGLIGLRPRKSISANTAVGPSTSAPQ